MRIPDPELTSTIVFGFASTHMRINASSFLSAGERTLERLHVDRSRRKQDDIRCRKLFPRGTFHDLHGVAEFRTDSIRKRNIVVSQYFGRRGGAASGAGYLPDKASGEQDPAADGQRQNPVVPQQHRAFRRTSQAVSAWRRKRPTVGRYFTRS